MKIALLLSTALITFAADPKPVIGSEHYRIYRGDGSPATLDQLVAESRAATVTFLGESHDDAVAHYLEEQVVRQAWDADLALSFEMFERDVQYVLDEYLGGFISEDHLLKSGRAWSNYKQDYKPMIEFAKEKKMAVVAANAPRRYVNRVSRMGAASLLELSAEARAFLPPLPYAKASPDYATKFSKVMDEHREDNKPPATEASARGLEAQSLWDASMSYSVADFLTRNPGKRVVHVNGSFHTAQRLGTVEHLLRYRPQTSVIVVTMLSDASFPAFKPATMSNQGTFVIVTDPKLPRSFTSDAPSGADPKK